MILLMARLKSERAENGKVLWVLVRSLNLGWVTQQAKRENPVDHIGVIESV
jgi:hypothetical protein